MAQRIYLIPIKSELISAFAHLFQVPESEEEPIWQKLESYAQKHQKLSDLSRAYASGLDATKMEKTGKLWEHGLWTAMRPYFITTPSAEETVAVVRRLRNCGNLREANSIFNEQAQRAGGLWARPENATPSPGPHADNWRRMRERVTTLKKMRSCYAGTGTFTATVPKIMADPDSGMQFMTPGETEKKMLSRTELPAHYGSLLGSTIGTLAGMLEPTWWLGRNYWLAALRDLPVPDDVKGKARMTAFQSTLGNAGRHPSVFLHRIGLPGFQKGLDDAVPTYNIGLFLSADKIEGMLPTFQTYGYEWCLISWGLMGFAHSPEIAECLVQNVQEAFLWASSEKCGLVEGDDLVGSYGAR